MNKSTKIVGITAVAIVLLAGVSFAVINNNDTDDTTEDTSSQQSTEPTKEAQKPAETAPSSEAAQSAGRYASYSEDKVKDASYDTSIVFFYAPWCSECQAFKKAIQADSVPTGTQILEADYDSSTDLKKKYGVTLQTTFVRVNNNGDLQKKWAGYGKDKSLAAVLENVK